MAVTLSDNTCSKYALTLSASVALRRVTFEPKGIVSSTVVVYVLLGLNTGPFSLRVTPMLTMAVAVCVATPLLMACTRSYNKT